jgi:hypothetical protein
MAQKDERGKNQRKIPPVFFEEIRPAKSKSKFKEKVHQGCYSQVKNEIHHMVSERIQSMKMVINGKTEISKEPRRIMPPNPGDVV